MNKYFLLFLSIAIFVSVSAQTNKKGFDLTLSSPDDHHIFRFSQNIDGTGKSNLNWSVNFKNRPVILDSRLGLTLDNHTWENALAKEYAKVDNWFDNLILDSIRTFSKDETWKNPLGERSVVKEAFNGIVIYFKKPDNSQYRLQIEVRAYNEGIAFRYIFPMHPDAIYHRIISDNTEFTMPEGTQVWFAAWAQGKYSKIPLSNWTDLAERPLTTEIAPDLFACITEAAQIDFPRGKFKLSNVKKNTIKMQLDGEADLVTPFTTPWRIVMVANRLGSILENNDIILNLNEASKLKDTEWIKPGKIIRETTLTTENAIACIDFCAAHKMQYILFDWKWYGPAFDFASDASEVVAPGLDMPKVIAYGKEKGIGVWLYVNQQALQTQADVIFPIYRKWGIAGIKFGFVEFATHHWSVWVHETIKKAAQNNLMVNIHDEYRPTGNQRTWPNLLTAEGIHGNEEFPTASHNTCLPFTRGITGPADYTVCYFDPRLIHTTHAHQLALPVIFFSPLQTFYWYDTPKRIQEVPELEFFDKVPVVWDDTKVLHDNMGSFVTIARRSGTEWFSGTICGDEPQIMDMPLNFLDAGKNYVANIYTDDESVSTVTKVKISRMLVNSGQNLKFVLKAGGGCAMHFEPANKDNSKGLKKYKGKTR